MMWPKIFSTTKAILLLISREVSKMCNFNTLFARTENRKNSWPPYPVMRTTVINLSPTINSTAGRNSKHSPIHKKINNKECN